MSATHTHRYWDMMRPMHQIVWIAAVVTIATAGWPSLTRILPEPATATPDKITYRDTYSLRSLIAVCAAAAVTMIAATMWAPAPTWPTWALLATIGAWVAVIDAITTWIPAALAWTGWAGWIGAVAVTALSDQTAATRAVIATTIIFAAWMIAWLISRGGFGFSDVRITPLWAAPVAATGIDTIHATVIAGLALIALYALIDRFRHHTTRFLPWAPSLCSGALIGLAIAH